MHVHEYCKRPLHGKVAVVDDDWSTVGSSNLDPLSLSLNLEANVVLRDRAFADCLRGRLQHLIDHECRPARVPPPSRWSFWPQLRSALVFHFLRHFSTWAGYLPRHAPKLKVVAATAGATRRDGRTGAGAKARPWRAHVATDALPTLRPAQDRRTAGARLRDRTWYPAAKRALTILFFVAVLGLVANHARSVDWNSVWAALRAYSAGTLLLAAGFAAASHALYCGYDLIGRHETGHGLPARTGGRRSASRAMPST